MPQIDSEIKYYYNHLYLQFQIYKLFLLHKAGSIPDDQWELAATEADQILNLTQFGRTFRKENVAYWQMWKEMEKLESKDLSKFQISLRTTR